MKATMIQNAAGSELGCFGQGEVICTDDEPGTRQVDVKTFKMLVDSEAALELTDRGEPVRTKAEKATKPKAAETATKGG